MRTEEEIRELLKDKVKLDNALKINSYIQTTKSPYRRGARLLINWVLSDSKEDSE